MLSNSLEGLQMMENIVLVEAGIFGLASITLWSVVAYNLYIEAKEDKDV